MISNTCRRSPKDKAATAELRRQVVELRRQHLTFEQIGERLSFSAPRAYKVYTDALKAIPAPSVDQHRREQELLIDDQVRRLIEVAANHADDPAAVARVSSAICRWCERKAKLLGLDMPQVNVNIEPAMVRYTINGVEFDNL